VSKTTALLDHAQPLPFLRGQYTTVRNELGPRLAHTRDVAVPAAMDMSHKAVDMSNKVRNEYLPTATKRAMLAAAALRGAELERARERRTRRWGVIAAATAAGAALGVGAYLWQRKRSHDLWYEEVDETRTMSAEGAPADPTYVDHH
jgi:hypothetical protein